MKKFKKSAELDGGSTVP